MRGDSRMQEFSEEEGKEIEKVGRESHVEFCAIVRNLG